MLSVVGFASIITLAVFRKTAPADVLSIYKGVLRGIGLRNVHSTGPSSPRAGRPQAYPPLPDVGGPQNRDGMVKVSMLPLNYFGHFEELAVRCGRIFHCFLMLQAWY